MRILLLFSIAVSIVQFSIAQNMPTALEYPEVGKQCPNFLLQNIQYFRTKRASLSDFRGKWLLLDFWSLSCGACIAAFPHINEIQKELGDKVQVMMVGIEDRQRKTELLYSRYRIKESLLMPCAFDSALARKFDYTITPRTVLIDEKGIVQCLTTTMRLNDMKEFLSGRRPTLPKSYRMNEDMPVTENHVLAFDYRKPFAIHDNGAVDTDFLFRSILAKWRPNLNKVIDNGSFFGNALWINSHSISLMGVNLNTLYFYAYLGEGSLSGENYRNYYNKLILDIPDSSLFESDFKTGKNLFCYSIDLPYKDTTVTPKYVNETGKRIMKMMQHDLENYFGFVGSFETRIFPCWDLVCTSEGCKKIKPKGAQSSEDRIPGIYYKGTNISFEKVFDVIKSLAGQEIIFDRTGMTGNVDVDLDCENCLLTQIEDLNKALLKNGLELIKSEKRMKVLVIHCIQ